MIIEIRRYTSVQGRLHILIDRFNNHLPRLFERLGIRLLGSWVVTAGANCPTLLYATAFSDEKDREAKWDAFYADAEWSTIRSETQGNEEVVDQFARDVIKVDLSTMAGVAAQSEFEVDDLVYVETLLGQTPAATKFLIDEYISSLVEKGATCHLIGEVKTGERLPKTAFLVRWVDARARADGWLKQAQELELIRSFATQRLSFGRSLIGQMNVFSLTPIGVQRIEQL
ncbi:NIPSNAP family protein [Paraburkholderia youngii]|uniref:NIPSNAP family protein n=1 Tax=Paraburkholderia youngii TaxID=2782701 RepID=UPI003D22247B